MLSGFFGGKRPPETPPSQGATRGADARGARASSSAEAAGGVVLGPPDVRSTSGRNNPEHRNPDDIPDGDMPALFERCQELLAKTAKRADIGAKTVTRPATPHVPDSLSARVVRAGTPQLSNQKTYVSPPDDDDDDLPTSLTQPEDESRQFLRLNMIKRLVARLRAGLDDPAVLDAGERLAWAAQIEFLEEDVDRAVERVTGMAHERDPPTPKRINADGRNHGTTAEERELGGMFAGLDVGGTPAGSSRLSGGADSGDLFSGLDLTPPPRRPPPAADST